LFLKINNPHFLCSTDWNIDLLMISHFCWHLSEFHDTWTFVNRRIKDALDLQKSYKEVAYLTETLGAGIGGSIQGVLNKVFQK
uniref:Uncharacterized protein n=1 Tax=Aegilops tauschii subsp. strangulata TaxID=200361 RepID=A0A453RGV7_AEGTS